MAGGAIVNTAGAKDYPGKLTLFVFFTCVVAATGGLIFGYDIGISGTYIILISSSSSVFVFIRGKAKLSKGTTSMCKVQAGRLVYLAATALVL
ncbi:hypothetical protein EJB05_13673, partial [Eragrostis curvula]